MKYFLIFSILLLIVYIYLLKKELRSIEEQLKDRVIGNSYFKISFNFATDEIRDLILALNQKLEEYDERILELVNKSKLDKTNITNISHDLRTPLTSIKGYLSLFKTANDEDRERYFEIISNKTKEMEEKLDAFYSFSQIISRDIIPNNQPEDLIAIISEEILNFYDEFENKGQDLKLIIPEESYIINTDESIFRRILGNLLSNMLKYSEGDNEIKIEILDDGFYMRFKNRADLKEIGDISILLDRSFTMDHSRSNRSTGLGLSIVKELSDKLGFEIELEKDETNFYISLFKKTDILNIF
ncbi:MAG: HAMP domain-containing sensor histidine kinase [Tissierellia bacterium]|nr:HAMP domain-containing sensor histidine kinase [Tissierellia bacterium]